MINTPLAEVLRPQSLSEVVGQPHVLHDGSLIFESIRSKRPRSLLLWGPPGCGKTTIAKLYAASFEGEQLSFSAVFQSVSEIKKKIAERENSPLFNQRLILFVDEIHRFNKAQQDLFLPLLEKGKIILIGATTENPSFMINNALLSRMSVLQLKPLDEESLEKILVRGLGEKQLGDEAKAKLIACAGGDGRHLINMIESIAHSSYEGEISLDQISSLIQQRSALYDRGDDGHYNLISALHKAVRGSDPDASLYWLARMLEGGECRHFLARRITRMAIEDVGLSDPKALEIAVAAHRAYEQMGSPEGDLALAQAVVYLTLAPKSNAIYIALKKAQKLAKESSHRDPPKIILNAPTKLMKGQGYGKGYQYDHDAPNQFSGQHYFPEGMDRESFYQPKEVGFERELKKRMEYFNKLRES